MIAPAPEPPVDARVAVSPTWTLCGVDGLKLMDWVERVTVNVTDVEPAAYAAVAPAVAWTVHEPVAVNDKVPLLAATVQPVVPAEVTA